MIHHREDLDVEPLFQLGFGKRPREELYDLKEDPHYLRNVADDPAYANIKGQMEARLKQVLEEQDDPRLMEQPCRYEYEPYAGVHLMLDVATIKILRRGFHNFCRRSQPDSNTTAVRTELKLRDKTTLYKQA